MKKKLFIDTPHGTLNYYVDVCDNCGKTGLQNQMPIIPLEMFFSEFRYLFTAHRDPSLIVDTVKGAENITKIACSTKCCDVLMKKALADFYSLWNASYQ